MFSKIIEAEHQLNGLLPANRLEQSPSVELLAAASNWSQLIWERAEGLGQMPLSEIQVDRGLTLARHPVFICGVHRSGTTLVRDILDGHPNLAVLPSEGTYHTNLEVKLLALPENERARFLGTEWLRRLANPINQPPYWLLGRSAVERSSYVDFARYLMAWWPLVRQNKNTQWPHLAIVLAYASCTNNKAALWVDKTPSNERFLKRIWHEMPAAKIIQVIREPVATFTSRKKMEPGLNIRQALHDLKASFCIAVEQMYLNDPRFLIVRYEELCEDPVTITQTIADFLNISFSDALNEPTVAGKPAQANSSFNRDAAPGKILKADQHRQEEKLSVTERRLIAAYIGNLAAQLGYPQIKISVLHKIYLRFRYRL